MASHPGYQAAEMNFVEPVPLFGTPDGGWVGVGVMLDDTRSHDGAAVTTDTARAERRTGVSISLGSKEGEGIGANCDSHPVDINTDPFGPPVTARRYAGR